jgi:hypothetical protein
VSTAVWVEKVDPDEVGPDDNAWWYGERVDVHAEAPGANPPCLVLYVGPKHRRTRLTVTQARALMCALLSAADWAEGKT